MNELGENLSKLIKTFNDKRVISEGEIKEVLAAIVAILAENKKGVDSLNSETKTQLEQTVSYLSKEHQSVLKALQGDLTKTRSEVAKATKEQNERAFKRLQDLIAKIRMPLDGKDGQPGIDGLPGEPGKDGSPDSAEQVRDKLETLKDEDRLDASAIKNLPKFIKEKAKELVAGGVRYFEQLNDVSIPITDKRQNLIAQYTTTNKRWESGIAITVSTTQPTNPKLNDLWVQL